MLKMFFTLARGGAANAAEQIADANALVILDQQVRDASAALERAKKSMALAIAQDRQESQRLDTLTAQIADIEQRVTAALGAGNETMARRGAEAIAALESDRDAALTARRLFAGEIERLRAHVAQAQTRIAAVDRGRRIARAAEAVRDLRRGRIDPAWPQEATLSEAETTLARLRQRQMEAVVAEEALDEIDASVAPARVAEQLAAAGFGPKVKSTADDVIARLKAKAQSGAAA